MALLPVPVVGHFQYLVGKEFDVDEVFLGDLCAHRRFRRLLDRLLLLGVEHISQVSSCKIPAIAFTGEQEERN